MMRVASESIFRRRSRAALAAALVFLVALVARLAFLWWRGPHTTPDSVEYLALARNITAHAAYSLQTSAPFLPSIRRPPLYPVFLAMLCCLGHPDPLAVAVIQSILDA